MATKDGKIVDEINGIISSRDSIRTTMLDAGVNGVTNSSKLADLAVKLADAKLPTTTYNVSKTDQTIIPTGKLTTGSQIIRAVTTSGIEEGNIKYGAVAKVGDAADDDRIITVTGTFTKEDNNPITSAMVLSGKVGYVNGAKVTGNIPTVTPSTDKLDCGKSATIAKGYLASAVTITANSLASQTPGTAAAEDILSGKIAWVDGAKVTGNIPTVTPSTTGPLICGASASISKGYLASDVTITAKDLASQTPGTAAAADIRSNKTAWVGGTSVTGTMPDGTYSASVSTSAGSASMTATGVSTTTSSNCYVTLSTTPGSAKGTATVGTGGYITAGSKESSTSVSVNGNGDRLYLAINYYYTSLDAPSSTTGYNDGDIWLVVNPDV